MLGSGNGWETRCIKHKLCPQGTHTLLEDTAHTSLTRTQPENNKHHTIDSWLCWSTKAGVVYSAWRNTGKTHRSRNIWIEFLRVSRSLTSGERPGAVPNIQRYIAWNNLTYGFSLLVFCHCFLLNITMISILTLGSCLTDYKPSI